MIFAAETEECELHVFPDAETAACYCEGLAVEATIWHFWDDAGKPLMPEFSVPNQRGLFTNKNGLYHLVPHQSAACGLLQEALEHIRVVVGEAPFTSVGAVRHYLDRPGPGRAAPG